MKVMKKLLFIALAAIIMAACSDEKPCPLCGGEGTVSVRGVEQTCLLCLGEKTVTEKQYYDYLKALGNVGSPGPASAPKVAAAWPNARCAPARACSTPATWKPRLRFIRWCRYWKLWRPEKNSGRSAWACGSLTTLPSQRTRRKSYASRPATSATTMRS